jgi:hypothetical protein
MELVISWDGAAAARLHYVIDNDVVVATDATGAGGHSPIRFPYEADEAAIHVIEWSLWFPGEAIANATARLSINGGASVALDAQTGEIKTKWPGRGAAP